MVGARRIWRVHDNTTSLVKRKQIDFNNTKPHIQQELIQSAEFVQFNLLNLFKFAEFVQ